MDENTSLENLRDILINSDGKTALADRFRALFYLKSIGSEFTENKERADNAIEYISKAFIDDSELLKHEVAYCLGQTHNLIAAPVLRDVLSDLNQQCMVRHEAAEALGALGDKDSLNLLEKYFNDPKELLEIKQTCELAIERIKWENSKLSKEEILQKSLYESVDPAPPLALNNSSDKVNKLQLILNDNSEPLFQRYRAMFRLRDLGTDDACIALSSGFNDESALFKHEIAYIFGQMCNPVTVPSLVELVQRENEAPMVRHEAAEALGAIATDETFPVLKKLLQDKDQVVRDSAVVALDMWEYENSGEMEYAKV
ncbi:deoxyhypusine hydroxylase [Pichia californica]|uniref:Deoxyhypusine hydroxylase n=1 Tax=Pichia californica TaxID=460514 RepID=A0A9P6WGM2_9ASCO|nr:deoxyhypusine hydroxylase [[Candida] californica]KAG0686577.1 deoxyhypusine hydroxylase [[Candida] californica]